MFFAQINPGDTLVSLSVKYGISANKIKQYNSDICFRHRLGHITGKLLLIANGSNAVLTEKMKKRIDQIYKNDNKYNLDKLNEKEYSEPDENGKYALRKALMYNAKGLDQWRADYYLGATKWNVRKALKLWKADDIWEKQQRVVKELGINAEEAMILLENYNWNIQRVMQQRKQLENKMVLKQNSNKNSDVSLKENASQEMTVM